MLSNDLFSLDFTTGDLNPIAPFVTFLGTACSMVISVVGFSIVMSAIFKNCVAGLYATNPKLWDKVDQLRKAGIKLKGTNQVSQLISTVGSFLLKLLPNVKTLTDFDDGPLDAKAYFMKAIPMMCVQIFIGVFIFFGYPSMVAEKASAFGTGLFDIVLTNVDPAAWVEALPEKLAVLSYSTDGAKDDQSQQINKIAKSATNALIGKLSDMTKEKRISVALEVESWVIENTNSTYFAYCNTDKYRMSVTSRVEYTKPNLDRVNVGENEDGTVTFAFAKELSAFDTGSTMVDGSMWLRYDLVFMPVASKADTLSVDCTASIPNAQWVGNTSKGSLVVTFANDNGSGFGLQSGARTAACAVVNNKSIDVKMEVNGNVLTITGERGEDVSSATKLIGVQKLYYYSGEGRHAITEMSASGVANTIFTPATETDIAPWDWGNAPSRSSSNTSGTSVTTPATNGSWN